ncbi:MAG: hypothetical protein WC147_02550 [Syntrophomonas sp.]|jgi:hypothetical protein
MKGRSKGLTLAFLIITTILCSSLPVLAATTIIYNGGSGWSQSGSEWHSQSTGRDGQPLGYSPPMVWTWNNSSSASEGGSWSISNASGGCYIYAYIPRNYADVNQRYYIWDNNTIIASSLVNQASYADQWVNLGYYSIVPSHTVRVQFDDFTPGVSSNTRYVGFDEMRFVF